MEVITEMKKYMIDIIGVSETRWRGNGAKNKEDFYVVYSGVTVERVWQCSCWKILVAYEKLAVCE